MKVRNLVRAYEKLVQNADDYFRAKVDLSKIENDYFLFFPVEIVEAPPDVKDKMRMVIANTDDDFNHLGIFFFDFDPNEMDYFLECNKNGVPHNVKKVSYEEALIKPEPPEMVEDICEDCGEIHKLEGH